MPKRISFMEIYATAWFAVTFALSADIYFSLKLNLYGYFLNNEIEWKTLIVFFGIYPTYNAIYLNYFPKKRLNQILYILGHSLILVTYEWVTVQIGAFHYNEWNPLYSAIAYPFILLILYLNFRLLRMLMNKEKNKRK